MLVYFAVYFTPHQFHHIHVIYLVVPPKLNPSPPLLPTPPPLMDKQDVVNI